MMRPDEVHVWVAEADLAHDQLATFSRLLDRSELLAAGRYRLQVDRNRFIARRAIRRIILASYAGREPTELSFRSGEGGKPQLSEGIKHDALQFNVSHSHGVVVCAVARGRRVGVDLERISKIEEAGEIIGQHASAEERRTYATIAAQDKERCFYVWWTRKEAYVKATGTGLYIPLDSYSVTFAPGDPPQLHTAGSTVDQSGGWFLSDLNPGEGYVGALVVERGPVQVLERRWERSVS